MAWQCRQSNIVVVLPTRSRVRHSIVHLHTRFPTPSKLQTSSQSCQSASYIQHTQACYGQAQGRHTSLEVHTSARTSTAPWWQSSSRAWALVARHAYLAASLSCRGAISSSSGSFQSSQTCRSRHRHSHSAYIACSHALARKVSRLFRLQPVQSPCTQPHPHDSHSTD